MSPIYRIAATIIAAHLFSSCAAITEEQDNAFHQLPTVNERRLKLVAEKIESFGCILDERAILEAKDGQPVVFKHTEDPRGNITVTFNHLVLPRGNWILFQAKNSIDGHKSEDPPENFPTQMEAVSAIISGTRLNCVPRNLDGDEVHSTVCVHIARVWRNRSEFRYAGYRFDYVHAENSKVGTRDFNAAQIPIVNILHRDENGEVIAGALCWFENQAVE